MKKKASKVENIFVTTTSTTHKKVFQSFIKRFSFFSLKVFKLLGFKLTFKVDLAKMD